VTPEVKAIEAIDRMYLSLYVSTCTCHLQQVNGVVSFCRGHQDPSALSALMDPISRSPVAGSHRFCRELGVPMVDFAQGQRNDDMAAFTGTVAVLLVGRVQPVAVVDDRVTVAVCRAGGRLHGLRVALAAHQILPKLFPRRKRRRSRTRRRRSTHLSRPIRIVGTSLKLMQFFEVEAYLDQAHGGLST
jgi:hypothetical protein